ncbi:MAG: acyl-CoA dehydrogenase [Alphaproteobacteria bacterium]|nr:acyl-CoA dehydrogenase [Alphaproteobacteria bacterium]
MPLTEAQRLVRETARRFAQEEILPHAQAWEAAGRTPAELFRKAGQVGLTAVCVPPQWGGAGADLVSYVLAIEEVAAADGGISNMLAGSNSPVAAALTQYGSDEQKRRYLVPLASGECLGAILLTEPQAGSDASNLRTRARRHGGGWRLSGTKAFITMGESAAFGLVIAVTDPAAGKRGIGCFIVPTDAPGYRVLRVEDKLGHRTCDTCLIALDDIELPAEALLGRADEGYRIALANLSVGRIGVAAQSVGMARAAFERALGYAKEREAFGQAIVQHQAVAFRLAEMSAKIAAARAMYLHAAALETAGRQSRTAASQAKLYASEMAEWVCSQAIQIHGGYGYLADYWVEKIYRDVRVTQIYEGTSEVQKIVIARELDRQ